MRLLLKLTILLLSLLSTVVGSANAISLKCWNDVVSKATQEHTVYVISRKLDLRGRTFRVPKGSTLKFKQRGCILNGSIVFNETTLVKPKFLLMEGYSGSVMDKVVYAHLFPCKDDERLLRFLFDQAASGKTLELESGASYTIDCGKYNTWKKWDDFTLCSNAFVSYSNLDGFTINGNGATINFINEPEKRYIYILYLRNCSQVTIKGLNLQGSVDYYEAPRQYAVEFIKAQFEASNYYIEISANKVSIPFSYGDYYQTLSDKGLSDSHIYVKGLNTRYNIRVHGAYNCDFQTEYERVHRGMYLGGIKNCSLSAKGKNVWTGVGVLLTTARMRNGLLGASAVKVHLYDTGTIRNNNDEPLPPYLKITSAGNTIDGGIFSRETNLAFSNIDVEYHASEQTNSMVICPVRFTESDNLDLYGRSNVPPDIVQVKCRLFVPKMNSNMWNKQAKIYQVNYILQYWHKNVISDYTIDLHSDDTSMTFVGYIASHNNQIINISCPENKLQVYPFPNSASDIVSEIDSTAVLRLIDCPNATLDADPIQQDHGHYARILIGGTSKINNRGTYLVERICQ